MRCLIITGVTGCGKSSLGMALAGHLGGAFFEGEDLHPPLSLEKLSAGVPLTNEDRRPWLMLVADQLRTTEGLVVSACPVLTRWGRDLIRERLGEPLCFLSLEAPAEVLAKRLADRAGPTGVTPNFQMQLDVLEPLESDEPGATIDIDRPLDAVVADVMTRISVCGLKIPGKRR